MRLLHIWFGIAVAVIGLFVFEPVARAQNAGSSTSISGTVTDPTGAVVVNATVTIHNPVSGFERTAATDSSGNFSIDNIPFNPYHMTVTIRTGMSLARRTSARRSELSTLLPPGHDSLAQTPFFLPALGCGTTSTTTIRAPIRSPISVQAIFKERLFRSFAFLRMRGYVRASRT